MKFSCSTALVAAAFGSVAVAQNLEELATPYKDIPGVSNFFDVYGKYTTMSGWSEFEKGFGEAFLKYFMTNTDLIAALPTATDAAVLSSFTDSPAFGSLTDGVFSFATSYIAAETALPKEVKASLVSDIKSLETIAAPGGAADASSPTATGAGAPSTAPTSSDPNAAPTPGAANAGKVFSLSAVAAGALVAVAFVL